MIYNKNTGEYSVYFYQDSLNNKAPVLEYIYKLSTKEQAKISACINFLCDSGGYLNEPYSRYIRDGVRELRVDLSRRRHRVFYVTVEGKRIIFLHSFLKKTPKTPEGEIKKALNNFEDYKLNKKIIKYEK